MRGETFLANRGRRSDRMGIDEGMERAEVHGGGKQYHTLYTEFPNLTVVTQALFVCPVTPVWERPRSSAVLSSIH